MRQNQNMFYTELFIWLRHEWYHHSLTSLSNLTLWIKTELISNKTWPPQLHVFLYTRVWPFYDRKVISLKTIMNIKHKKKLPTQFLFINTNYSYFLWSESIILNTVLVTENFKMLQSSPPEGKLPFPIHPWIRLCHGRKTE